MRAWPATAPRTEPPNPLPGYRVAEITLAGGSPAAGTRLGDIRWPARFLPVSVLCGRNLRQPDPRTVVRAGDRIALLTPDLFLTGSEEKINNQ